MPEFTIYAKIFRLGRRRTHKVKNTPVHRVHSRWPVDYKDLEGEFLQAGREIYKNFKQTESEVTFERHLSGQGKKGMSNYHETNIHVNRSLEVKAKITYSSRLDTIRIRAASFVTPEAFEKYKLDYDFVTQKKWKLKEVINPGVITELLDPDAIFRNQLSIKTPNYDPMPIGVYSSHQERHWADALYDAVPHGTYGSNDSTVESDLAIRQGKIKG